MNLTRNRIRSIGWAVVLTTCVALTIALTLRVNAVKGQVRESENRIVSLKRDIQFLEVEFQTRANQQQLSALNSVEFGYGAPGAEQYLEGERQLAALGLPPGPDAPRPIRMVNAVSDDDATPFIAMVSPVGDLAAEEKTKRPETAESAGLQTAQADKDAIGEAIARARPGARLARVEFSGGADE